MQFETLYYSNAHHRHLPTLSDFCLSLLQLARFDSALLALIEEVELSREVIRAAADEIDRCGDVSAPLRERLEAHYERVGRANKASLERVMATGGGADDE